MSLSRYFNPPPPVGVRAKNSAFSKIQSNKKKNATCGVAVRLFLQVVYGFKAGTGNMAKMSYANILNLIS